MFELVCDHRLFYDRIAQEGVCVGRLAQRRSIGATRV